MKLPAGLDRQRPQAGRYRFIWTASWLGLHGVSPHARLTLRVLETGTQSNMAGIGFAYVEALLRETGLTAAELEAALDELGRLPTLARSFIVRDPSGVVWVRDLLKNDPARDGDPNITNEKHRRAVTTTLGSLPRDSKAVRKFREYYGFRIDTPSHRVTTPPTEGAPGAVRETPDTGLRTPEIEHRNPEPERESTRGRTEAASPPARFGGAPATPSSNGNGAGSENDPNSYTARFEQFRREHPEHKGLLEAQRAFYAVLADEAKAGVSP